MSIVDKIKEKKEREINNPPVVNEVEEKKVQKIQIDFSLDELEFIIRLIGSSNFKGNDLMFIYELVNKLQNLYLDKKGVE